MQQIFPCLILANFILGVYGRYIRIECPSYCECDILFHLKRASCVNKTIVVIQIDLPPQTQLLDISYNQISQLNDYAFSQNNLTELKLLNISHNKLSQINVYAFDRLDKLRTLDLSNNVLQYILPNWFNFLRNLKDLRLGGNNFGDMSNIQKCPFKSETLEVLDLSKSYISYLPSDVFRLPKLKYLDLSGNQLLSLNPKVIGPLKNLRSLKIVNNTFSCNKGMIALTKLTERRKIEYKDPCAGNKNKKFEKMILQTTTELTKSRFWMIEENQDVSENDSAQHIPCELVNKESLITLTEFPYLLLIITVLGYGILIGFICGCGVKHCSMRHKIKNYRNRNPVKLRGIKRLDNETRPLTMHADELGHSTPIFTRK